jgi:hypothetical protein
MIGAAKLDVPTYEEVEHDENATTQALIVVAVVAIAAGIGAVRDDGVGGLIGGIIFAVVGWLVFSGVAYLVGTRLVPGGQTEATFGQLLRTLGFAQTPSILAVFGLIPVLGAIIAFVASIWTIVTQVVAIRQALDISTGRAIAVAVISIIVLFVVAVILVSIGLGIALAGS